MGWHQTRYPVYLPDNSPNRLLSVKFQREDLERYGGGEKRGHGMHRTTYRTLIAPVIFAMPAREALAYPIVPGFLIVLLVRLLQEVLEEHESTPGRSSSSWPYSRPGRKLTLAAVWPVFWRWNSRSHRGVVWWLHLADWSRTTFSESRLLRRDPVKSN